MTFTAVHRPVAISTGGVKEVSFGSATEILYLSVNFSFAPAS
jgi:hypothetical protein